jgi:hypothetical protein
VAIACDQRTPTEVERLSARQAAASLDHDRGDDRDDGDDGRDRGWLLGGTAELARDPENPANHVIRISTVDGAFGSVSRRVNTKIHRLDNMLEFKAWFEVGKTCFGGAPRLQLAIDLDGDGTAEGNAFGYFGAGATTTGCPPETWLFEDLTGGGDNMLGLGPVPSTGRLTPNEEPEWDLTQFRCPVGTTPPGTPTDPCFNTPAFVVNWSLAETLVSAFPNHVVCTVALGDETFGAPGLSGIA